MPEQINPLNQQHCDSLTECLKSAHGTRQLCQDIKECGLPVDELHAANEQQINAAQAIKRKFFPLQP